MKTSEHNGARVPAPIALGELPNQPLVSVVVANYNYGRYLPDMVQSVLNQTYANWELIICDDGSTDDSRSVLQKCSEKDHRIRIVLKENGGQASAWNEAYRHAEGEIIALLDADDWYRPEKLETVVRIFRERPSAGLLYHPLQPADINGAPLGEPHPDVLPDGWLYDVAVKQSGRAFPATTTMAFRRSLASRIFPVPDHTGSYADMYIGRIASFLTEIAAVPDTLTYYRFHGGNHSARGYIDPLCRESLKKWSEAHFITVRCQQCFIRREFGESLASHLRVEDALVLWDILGRLYFLSGKPSKGVYGYSPNEIRANLARSRKWLIWGLCFALPHPLSLWVLRAQVSLIGTIKALRRRVRNGLSRRHGAPS